MRNDHSQAALQGPRVVTKHMLVVIYPYLFVYLSWTLMCCLRLRNTIASSACVEHARGIHYIHACDTTVELDMSMSNETPSVVCMLRPRNYPGASQICAQMRMKRKCMNAPNHSYSYYECLLVLTGKNRMTRDEHSTRITKLL